MLGIACAPRCWAFSYAYVTMLWRGPSANNLGFRTYRQHGYLRVLCICATYLVVGNINLLRRAHLPGSKYLTELAMAETASSWFQGLFGLFDKVRGDDAPR